MEWWKVRSIAMTRSYSSRFSLARKQLALPFLARGGGVQFAKELSRCNYQNCSSGDFVQH